MTDLIRAKMQDDPVFKECMEQLEEALYLVYLRGYKNGAKATRTLLQEDRL